MQLWASRGFAVLFCNPTGGDGGGDEFADIRGQYGPYGQDAYGSTYKQGY